eukprot:Seg2024.4 transcript_id=Seg2024.4/GoldUCD/mRNA.D3Y31 product="RAD50-interacting protein 1" protein_id=Seg2024.4/GoldUCD/D3Y31
MDVRVMFTLSLDVHTQCSPNKACLEERLRGPVDTRHKMAASSEEKFSQFVVNFLDSEFGEDVEKLKEIDAVLNKHENISKSIESKVNGCKKRTKTKTEEMTVIADQQIKEIDKLKSVEAHVSNEVETYLAKNKELSENMKVLNDEIEQINCLQVYLSWIGQITHLSTELKRELGKGHIEIAIDFFINLVEISQRLSKSSCKNLIDFAATSANHWFKVLSNILVRNMDEILKKMKWPFATGISSPIMTDKNEDIMSQFDTTAKLLLKLHVDKKADGRQGETDALLLTTVLAKALQKRFVFHFYGARRTNNLEKPQWFFTQVLNWIRDHSPFLENYVQPIVDKEGLDSHYIQHEFIQALLQTCMEKIKVSLAQISGNESLFSHLIDETLLFDKELRSMFDYPALLPGCTSVLMTQPYLDHWLELEEKYAIDSINNHLSQDDAFDCKYNDLETNNATKIPLCIENFVIQISLLTDRCKSFDDTDTQLKFVELQLFLLRYFINKLEDIGDIEASSSNYKYLFALLNGSQYINDLLHEWSEHVYFIQLHCVKSQRSLKRLSKSVRLDDSMAEESIDNSMEAAADQTDSMLEKSLFDDIIASIDSLILSLVDKLLKNIEKELKPKIKKYREERWHCLPTSNQLITQMLSNGACDLLMNVKEILQTTHTELCSSIFTRLWQRFARSIDLLIYEEVILQSHFNEGGSVQLKFDLTKNLFVLFEDYTHKPDAYFKLSKESCNLLNLLPGSAVLLRDVLVASDEKTKKQSYFDGVNALFDVDVKNISPSNSLSILNSRIDWPKI